MVDLELATAKTRRFIPQSRFHLKEISLSKSAMDALYRPFQAAFIQEAVPESTVTKHPAALQYPAFAPSGIFRSTMASR
jgi:isochorismate hydrolase